MNGHAASTGPLDDHTVYRVYTSGSIILQPYTGILPRLDTCYYCEPSMDFTQNLLHVNAVVTCVCVCVFQISMNAPLRTAAARRSAPIQREVMSAAVVVVTPSCPTSGAAQVTHAHTHTHYTSHTHSTLHTHTHTHTHTAHYMYTHTHTHTHTCWFLWFTGTFHRRNGFYTVQTVCAIVLHLPYT